MQYCLGLQRMYVLDLSSTRVNVERGQRLVRKSCIVSKEKEACLRNKRRSLPCIMIANVKYRASSRPASSATSRPIKGTLSFSSLTSKYTWKRAISSTVVRLFLSLITQNFTSLLRHRLAEPMEGARRLVLSLEFSLSRKLRGSFDMSSLLHDCDWPEDALPALERITYYKLRVNLRLQIEAVCFADECLRHSRAVLLMV